MIDQIFTYFNWIAIVVSSIGVALVVTVANQTSPGQKVHNAAIALGAAVFFSVLFVDWAHFLEHWQADTIQITFTLLTASVVGFTRYQSVVDGFIGSLLKRGGVKGTDDDAKS